MTELDTTSGTAAHRARCQSDEAALPMLSGRRAHHCRNGGEGRSARQVSRAGDFCFLVQNGGGGGMVALRIAK
ncbi:MAG TPA: hypothetical protein V6C72_10395 [Chroococcales cyanobacterium]